MTTWYYSAEMDRKGPVDRDEIHRLIERGQINLRTYLWREGMNEGQVAGGHPDFAHLFAIAAALPVDPMSPELPQPALQPPAAKTGTVLTSRPWPRFWARFLDNLLFMPLLAFGIGVWSAAYAPGFYVELSVMNGTLFGLMILPLVAVLLAVIMTVVGSTPGKAVIGVQVPVPPGNGRFGFYLARELKIWVVGLGLGIPLVSLVTQVAQYRRLASGRQASYDEGNPPVVANPGKLRLSIAFALVVALFIGNSILLMEDQVATYKLATTRTWLSPVTGRTANIGRTWQSQPVEGGGIFYFISDELLSEAIFGHETLPWNTVDNAAYAKAIEEALASEININTEWQPVQVNGISGLRATGVSKNASDVIVELTVAVSGRDAWRTLMFSRGSSAEQMTQKDRFVNAMFGTAH
jgi:hypothetical protein